MKKHNTCRICGEPCRSKYCKKHAKEGYRQNYYKRKKVKFNGCNEDCAHCPYPDCLKPAYQIKSDGEIISKREKNNKRANKKCHTVSVGGIRSKL